MAAEVDVQYEASDESSENELLDKSLSVWKGWNVKETFDPIPLDLHTASSIGHYDCVRSFITRKVDLNRKNHGGWTPLMYACYIGHDNIVNLLLDAGVMVNIKNYKGQSPLMLAASCGNESVGYFICQQGAELEARDNKGWTALFHATYAGHQNMVRFLLEQGANINAVEPSMGMTPFMEAAAEGHEIIVQLFLQHGVKVNSKAHNGDTARSLALIYSHIKIVSLIDNHVMPITCLRSEAGLDADLSSSDESFPARRPAQPRSGRGKKQGPNIRDGPDAIARLINRVPSNDNTQGNNQQNSCVPKGYVSFKHNENEASEDAPRLSYRDVTSPINLQDYNTLESSGGKESCDNDIDEDGNAFSKTGALTIKSSSGSSGGLMAALGINPDSSSLDSDDCQPQDSCTSHSDRGSSLGGSCNSLNEGGPSPASSFNADKGNIGDEKAGAMLCDKPPSIPNEGKQDFTRKSERKSKNRNSERPDSTQSTGDNSEKFKQTSLPVQQTHVISPCGNEENQEITASNQIISPLPDVVNQQKTCNNIKSKNTAHVDFVIGQDYESQNYDNSKRRSKSHMKSDLQQGHRSKTDMSHNRSPNPTMATHGTGNFIPQNQGHLAPNMQQGHVQQNISSHSHMSGQSHMQQNVSSQGHMQQHISSQGHMQQNISNQGHMQQNMSGQGHVQQNFTNQGHIPQNLTAQGHINPNMQQTHQSHISNMQQGHMPPNIQGQGHIPPNSQGHMPPNIQGQGHMPPNSQGHMPPNIQGQGHMPANIQQSHMISNLQQGHLIPNSSDNGYHQQQQQQVFQNIGTSVSAHAQLGYQLFPSSAGISGNPSMTNSPMGPMNVNPMLQEQGFFNQTKQEEGDPKDLQGLLDQLGLLKYLAVFEEQDVDLQVFLSLTDSDLKEVGIKLFGPRKKMTNAITRWHNHGPPSRCRVEQAYADRLDAEIQDLTVQVHKSYEQVETLKAQVLQEQRIRNVTESCLTDIQRISFDTRSKCEEMKESLRKLKQYHTEIKIKLQPIPMNELAELQLDERSRSTSGEGRGETADMTIKRIEQYIKDLQKYLSVITMNADRLLSWGANNSHST